MAEPLLPDDFKEFLRLLNAHDVDSTAILAPRSISICGSVRRRTTPRA
jgi:hypothetical protein